MGTALSRELCRASLWRPSDPWGKCRAERRKGEVFEDSYRQEKDLGEAVKARWLEEEYEARVKEEAKLNEKADEGGRAISEMAINDKDMVESLAQEKLQKDQSNEG